MYSWTVLACPRYRGSLSRCLPVVPRSKGGPTCPFAPGTPGMTWQTGQPGLVSISISGSSPVTKGIFSGESGATTGPFELSCDTGGDRSAHTMDAMTNPTAATTTAWCRGPVGDPCDDGGDGTESNCIGESYHIEESTRGMYRSDQA